ncbi:MAG: DUF4339 domain-containing protein [Verrucomicrobiota bacterium]
MKEIYIYKDGENSGPFTRDEIFARVRQKEFSMEDLACTEGMPEWKPLAEVLSAKATMVILAERELPPAPPVIIPIDEPVPSFGTRLMETPEAEPAESADAVAGLKRLAAVLVLGACLYQFGWGGWERLRGRVASEAVRPAAAGVEEETLAGAAPVKESAGPERAVGADRADHGALAAARERGGAETPKGVPGNGGGAADTGGGNGSPSLVTARGAGASVEAIREVAKASDVPEREASPSQSAGSGADATEVAMVQGVDGAAEAGSVAVEQSPASREPDRDEDPDGVPGLAVQPASYFGKR